MNLTGIRITFEWCEIRSPNTRCSIAQVSENETNESLQNERGNVGEKKKKYERQNSAPLRFPQLVRRNLQDSSRLATLSYI